MSEQMSPEEYARMHQKAFRCAFDYLNQHFPPGEGTEWWEQACKDLSQFGIAAGENRLAIELLTGVYDYIEYVWKERYGDGKTDSE